MATSSIFDFPTPDGGTANDFAEDMAVLAEDIDGKVAGYTSGTFADRGTAASRNRYFYKVTDNTAEGGWFFSDGSNWVRITASPWLSTWTPTVTTTDGSTTSPISKLTSGATYQYRVLPDSMVEVLIEVSMNFSGTYGTYFGVAFSTPVGSARYWPLKGQAYDDVATTRVGDIGSIGNCISIFPANGFNADYWQFNTGTAYMGRWPTDGTAGLFLITGTYRV